MRPPSHASDWSPEVQRVYDHDVQEMWDSSMAPHVWNMYHSELDMYLSLAASLAPQTILDVGCAQGTLALMLAERGYRVWALDIREEFLRYAQSRYECGDIQFICGDILNLEFDRQYDLIFANQVVEHCIDPTALLRRLYGLLSPNGRLVMTTPNYGYFRNRLPSHRGLGDPTKYLQYHGSADGDGHFYALSKSEIAEYACRAGFDNVSVRYYASPWITGHCKFRYLHRWMPSSILRVLDMLTTRLPGLQAILCHQMLLLSIRSASSAPVSG